MSFFNNGSFVDINDKEDFIKLIFFVFDECDVSIMYYCKSNGIGNIKL